MLVEITVLHYSLHLGGQYVRKRKRNPARKLVSSLRLVTKLANPFNSRREESFPSLTKVMAQVTCLTILVEHLFGRRFAPLKFAGER